MRTIDDFVTLVRDEIGLPITRQDVDADLDQVPGWDSVHLLTLTIALERSTGRQVPMAEVLEASSLAHIYRLVVAE